MKSQIVIEKGIPIQDIHRPNVLPYDFGKMQHGDSFVVDGRNDRENILRCFDRRKKKNLSGTKGKSMTTRKLENGKYRIWIVENK